MRTVLLTVMTVMCLVAPVNSVSQREWLADWDDAQVWQKLDQHASEAAEQAYAAQTKKIYAPWIKRWTLFCHKAGRESPILDAEQWDHAGRRDEDRLLCNWASYWGSFRKLAAESVDQAMSALRAMHLNAGFGDPLLNRPKLKLVRKGLRKMGLGKKQKKDSATVEVVRAAVVGLRSRMRTATGGRMQVDLAARVAAITVAFAFLLRKSEYLGNNWAWENNRALRVEDISLHSMSDGCWAISLWIRGSKTDVLNLGERRVRQMLAEESPMVELCPVRAIAQWFQAEQAVGREWQPEQFAFVGAGGKPLDAKDVADALNQADVQVNGAARVKDRMGTHSLRSGGAVAMWVAGIPIDIIMREGRWKSMTFHRYLCSTEWEVKAIARAWDSGQVLARRLRDDGEKEGSRRRGRTVGLIGSRHQ